MISRKTPGFPFKMTVEYEFLVKNACFSLKSAKNRTKIVLYLTFERKMTVFSGNGVSVSKLHAQIVQKRRETPEMSMCNS